jgi:hypothetical protein
MQSFVMSSGVNSHHCQTQLRLTTTYYKFTDILLADRVLAISGLPLTTIDLVLFILISGVYIALCFAHYNRLVSGAN